MKKLVFDIIAFGLVAVSLNVGLIAWYNRSAEPGSWARQTESQLRSLQTPPRLLIFGDSHAKCAVMADRIPDAFNAATLGGQYYQVYYRLKAVLEQRDSPPELVLLPMDTHSLAWQVHRQEESAYWAPRINWIRVASESDAPFTLLKRYGVARALPYQGQGDDMVEWLWDRDANALPFPLQAGFVALRDNWAEVPEDERERRAAQHAAFLHDEYRVTNPAMLRYFDACLALCRDKGVRAVLVRYPVSKETWDAVNANVDLEGLNREYRGTAAIYFSRMVGLDYATLFHDQPEYFADADHLNAEGAAAFTAELANDLDVMLNFE